jgi:hypothetical protein
MTLFTVVLAGLMVASIAYSMAADEYRRRRRDR